MNFSRQALRTTLQPRNARQFYAPPAANRFFEKHINRQPQLNISSAVLKAALCGNHKKIFTSPAIPDQIHQKMIASCGLLI
jgi:hypothetical protein